MTDTLAAARSLFRPADGLAYLDTATYGLPPLPTVAALEAATRAWQAGTANWIDDWDRPGDQCRVDFATLIGAEAAEIASIPATSVGVGIVADRLGPGDEVIVPADEFTSTMYPLLVAGEAGANVREVAFERLAESVGPETRLIAFSLVQMQTGLMADLEGILDAAERHGARVFVDATQAVPFVEVSAAIDRIDYLACSAYKHLLSPRGVAFMYVRRDRWPELRPILSNWRAADDPFGRYFGGPLALADDARRFDISRAWFPWIAAVESLRLLVTWREQGLFDGVCALAERLAHELGQPWHGSTLVSPPIADAETVGRALLEAGIKASVRGTAVRLSPHIYTTEADVDRAIAALAPHVVTAEPVAT